MAALSNNHQREQVVDLGHLPFYIEHFRPMYKRPDGDDSNYGNYFKPFKYEVWLTVVATIPLGILGTWITWTGGPEVSAFEKLRSAIWFTFGAVLLQGEFIAIVIRHLVSIIISNTTMAVFYGRWIKKKL